MNTLKLNLAAKLGFLATAALFILNSCQQKKDTTITAASQTKPQYALKGTVDDAANEANPYDYVGLAHNASLQATRSVWTNNSTSTIPDISTAVTGYVQSTYDPTAVPPSNATIQQGYNTINRDFPNLGRNIIASSALSSTGKNYANMIAQALYNAPAGSTYFSIKSAVMNVEDQILNNSTLPASDRETLLKMASVGRYSMLYWINEANGANRGPSLETAMSVPGPLSASMYHIAVTISYTDYMSSTTVIMTRDYIYVETVTIFSAFQATFYF